MVSHVIAPLPKFSSLVLSDRLWLYLNLRRGVVRRLTHICESRLTVSLLTATLTRNHIGLNQKVRIMVEIPDLNYLDRPLSF